MTVDRASLQTLLSESLSEDIRVEQRPDGALMLRTHFEFPDGDRFPIYLSALPTDRLRLSDRGHTLMHISYEHDIDSFTEGTRGMLLERIMDESGLQWDGGALCFDVTPDRLAEAVFRFGQALTRVHDLTFLSRPHVGSTFYDDLYCLLTDAITGDKIQCDYLPDVPNAETYPVDYRLESKSNASLFVYGVHNRDKALLTTIMLSHFIRSNLEFESLLVFKNQKEIPRKDLARLSDVGGDTISSLEAREDFRRKLRWRIAT